MEAPREITVESALERRCPMCNRWAQLVVQATLVLMPDAILKTKHNKIEFDYQVQTVELHCPRCGWSDVEDHRCFNDSGG